MASGISDDSRKHRVDSGCKVSNSVFGNSRDLDTLLVGTNDEEAGRGRDEGQRLVSEGRGCLLGGDESIWAC